MFHAMFFKVTACSMKLRNAGFLWEYQWDGLASSSGCSPAYVTLDRLQGPPGPHTGQLVERWIDGLNVLYLCAVSDQFTRYTCPCKQWNMWLHQNTYSTQMGSKCSITVRLSIRVAKMPSLSDSGCVVIADIVRNGSSISEAAVLLGFSCTTVSSFYRLDTSSQWHLCYRKQ